MLQRVSNWVAGLDAWGFGWLVFALAFVTVCALGLIVMGASSLRRTLSLYADDVRPGE